MYIGISLGLSLSSQLTALCEVLNKTLLCSGGTVRGNENWADTGIAVSA